MSLSFLSFLSRPALALALGLGALSAADIDGVHSTALFTINHLGASNFIGRFDDVKGTIEFDAADVAKDKVTITIATDSVDTNFTKRDQHLKSPDFFDAKQFPTIEFVSDSFKKTGEKEYEVAGNLTLHGVTKPITVKVINTGEGKDPSGADHVGFHTEFTVKRTDYGMDKMVGLVGDEVKVELSTEYMHP